MQRSDVVNDEILSMMASITQDEICLEADKTTLSALIKDQHKDCLPKVIILKNLPYDWRKFIEGDDIYKCPTCGLKAWQVPPKKEPVIDDPEPDMTDGAGLCGCGEPTCLGQCGETVGYIGELAEAVS